MNDMQRIRVVVVDDHMVVRDGLRLILQIEGKDMELVGDAADGALALQLIEETQPDVVLMDLRMPGMDGVEAITQIRSRWPRIAVVILTTYNEDELMLRGLRAGACGYLLKDVNRETLLNAIRSAAQRTEKRCCNRKFLRGCFRSPRRRYHPRSPQRTTEKLRRSS